MPTFELAPLDLVMVGLYVLFIIGLGFYFAKRTQSEEDYFLAGRQLTWWLIGFSLLASNLSSSSLLGMAGEAYSRGIMVYNYEWMAALILIVFVIFFLPFYMKTRIFTMPEFLERRFDARSRFWFSGITILGNIIIDTAAALYAGAVVIGILYPDIPMWQSIAVLALLAGLYTVAGGLAAVVYTDAVQAVLLLLGSMIISYTAFTQVGSWDAVTAAVPEDALSLIRPIDDPVLPWTGLITGVFLLGFYFWTNNQFMVQRVLGAKNLDQGRWGSLFAGALKLPIIFIMVLPGTFARVLYPTSQYPALENPDYVFPTMMFDLLPVGLRGLIITALIAAIMSSVDSTLNSASTLVTMDFVKKLRPRSDRKTLLWVGRMTTFIFMIFAAAWAPVIVNFETIWQYLQEVLSYIAPPVVACFVIGIFWRRANATAAFAGLVGGHLSGLVFFILRSIVGVEAFQFQFLYISVCLFLVSVVIIVAVSLMTPPPDEAQVSGLIWTKKLFREETDSLAGVPWYKNYRIQAAILAVATLFFVSLFW